MSGGELTDYANNLHDVLDWADRIAEDAITQEHDAEYVKHMRWLAQNLRALYDVLFVCDRTLSGDRGDKDAVDAVKEYMDASCVHTNLSKEDVLTLDRCANDLQKIALRMYYREDEK